MSATHLARSLRRSPLWGLLFLTLGSGAPSTAVADGNSSDLTQLVSTDYNCHEFLMLVCFKLVCTPLGCSMERANDISYYLPAFFIEVIRSPGDSILEDGGSPGGPELGTAIDLADHSRGAEYGYAYEVRIWDIRELVEALLDNICLPCAYASAGIGVGTSGVHFQDERRMGNVPDDWGGGLDAFADAMQEVSSYINAYMNMQAMAEAMMTYGNMVMGEMTLGDAQQVSGDSDYDFWSTDKANPPEDSDTEERPADQDGGAGWMDDDDSMDEIGMSREESLGRSVAEGNEACMGVADVHDIMTDLGDITEEATGGFVRLIYTSEIDIFHWRTGCRDFGRIADSLRCIATGTGGESCIGHWGPLYPRSYMAHGGAAVTSALAAYRALHMADEMGLFDESDDDAMPDVFTDGIRINKSTKLQASLPEVSDCFNPGDRDDMEMTRATGYDKLDVEQQAVRFGYMMWVPDKCCLTDDELSEACQGF